MYDLAQRLSDYEEGNMSDVEALKLFSYLINTQLAWHLQGSYGRAADDYLMAGLIDIDGTINWERFDDCARND